MKTLTLRRKAPKAGRHWVWMRRGKDAFLVEPRLIERAVAGLDPHIRERLLARLRANTAVG